MKGQLEHRRADTHRPCLQHACCDRPAPINLAQAMHDRGEEVEHADYFWTTECFNCGYCCSCEV